MDNIAHEAERKHLAEQEKLIQRIQREYELVIQRISPLIAADAVQNLLDRKLTELLREANKNIVTEIKASNQRTWMFSHDKTVAYLDRRLEGSAVELPDHIKQVLYDPNEKALAEFQKRKVKGLGLSQRVWNSTKETKKLINKAVKEGIAEGKSAAKISKALRGQLLNPTVKTDPGQGVYRSPFKNTERLARTEMNIANRMADQVAWEGNPIILGYRINLSNTGSKKVRARCELCRSLKGEYPVDFIWTGWHPHCYSDDTEVQTRRGWKLFKDLLPDDLIYSLNPDTRQPEYVGYNVFLEKEVKGDMIRFHNRNLDMLVTPDHPMKYINKSNGRTFEEKTAQEYRSTHGGLYRSSEYSASDIETMTIGKHVIYFDLFTEFMAYYLAEGSLSWTRKNQFHIAQCDKKHTDQHAKILLLLEKMPFKFSIVGTGFYLRDADMYEYLKQFGKSPDKHVPEDILNSSPRQIGIFLDGYAICDGHTKKKKKSFIGSRGAVCIPNNHERMFFSSSDQMASDIGEMLTKIGKRPSYRLQKAEGIPQVHKNGTYEGKKDIWIISECHSATATVFNKTVEYYDGFVYDIQLERNHIMYVRRNGKCVWGSNCLCYKTPILMNREYLDKYNKLIATGEDTRENIAKLRNEAGAIDSTPNAFGNWVKLNHERVGAWKQPPLWWQQNLKVVKGYISNK